MVNTDDFIKRLEIILDYYSINASAFADKIGVQRSSLSHLLSGRNKPSLDFILKILEVYPEIDLYWILNGKGNFPKANSNDEKETLTFSSLFDSPEVSDENERIFPENKQNLKESTIKNPEQNTLAFFGDDIEKIVFFYKDGTFKSFIPNQKK